MTLLTMKELLDTKVNVSFWKCINKSDYSSHSVFQKLQLREVVQQIEFFLSADCTLREVRFADCLPLSRCQQHFDHTEFPLLLRSLLRKHGSSLQISFFSEWDANLSYFRIDSIHVYY